MMVSIAPLGSAHARSLRRYGLRPLTRLILTGVAALALMFAGSVAAAAEFRPGSGVTPTLVLRGLDGRPHDLAAYRGKVVLVNFWASWCEPCRDEMPDLDALKRRFANDDFEVLAVNYGESEARIRNFLAGMSVDLTVLQDPGSSVARDWKVKGLPASFLIDRTGKIREHAFGVPDWDEAAAARIKKLLRR